LSDHKSDVEGY